MSHKHPTASNENKQEEEKENFDDDKGLQADVNDNDSILLDNNEPTKTYERVVLEGSKIRMSCPHLLPTSITTLTISTHIMPPKSSLAMINRDEALRKQKRFAGASTLKPMLEKKKISEGQPIVHDYEHVKWFRNHVPLLNINHFHHKTKVLLDPSTPPVVIRNPSSSDDEHNNKGENPVIKITELTQKAINPSSKPPQSVAILVNNETLLEENQIQNNLLTNSVKQLQLKQQLLLQTKSSENANEYVQVRKRANMSARGSGQNNTNNVQLRDKEQLASELYINEFGELVINKVSQYFAGKYTCLANHRQSEVLLDVLVNSQAANNVGSERALKLGSADQANAYLKMVRESDRLPSIAHGELIDNSGVYLNSDDHETGNGPIEGRGQQQSAESADNKLSILDQINSGPNGAQNEDNSDVEAKSKNNGTKLTAESLSIEHLSRNEPLLKVERELRSSERDDNILKSKKIDNRDEPETENFETTSDSTKPVVLNEEEKQNKTISSNVRLNLQRIPAQIVESEIIRLDDLKNIPGFLYTKQHLYCPIGHLHWKHIYPLLRPFCPYDPRMVSNKFRCYHLIWRLISRIVSESFTGEQGVSSDCDNSILDILWFKDGNQLNFDNNGREKKSNLNIKLINILEQFSANASLVSSPPEWQHYDEPSGDNSVENYPNLPKANLSSKWICPLRGRTIEIDGVGKESIGRYTCALRMRISKLRGIIQKLYKLNRHGHSHHHPHSHYNRKLPLDSTLLEIDAARRPTNNDISCCNGLDEFSIGGNTTLRQRVKRREEGKEKEGPFKLDAQVSKVAMSTETMETENSTKSNQSPRFDEEMDKVTSQPIKTNSNHPLTKQIAIFKSILEGRFSREQWLEYMGQQLSRLQDPLAVIQSFSLLVAERSGECLCSIKF